MDRPQVVTKAELAKPPSEQSSGMQRGEAFAHKSVWAGYAAFPPGASTGWHHHGDYGTYAFIASGRMTVEFGPDGAEAVDVDAGDFVFIPPRLVHRETVSDAGGSGVVVRVGGQGPTVHNVAGPGDPQLPNFVFADDHVFAGPVVRPPAAPEEHRDDEAEAADQHQDDADHVQVDPFGLALESEGEDCTDCYEEDAESDTHGVVSC